jgi:hypothetical protein
MMIIETLEQFDERNSYWPSLIALYGSFFTFIILWSLL